MAWHDADSWLSRGFGPHLSSILLALLVAVTLPILLHAWLYRKHAPASAPSFLLLGPSGAGKTSLLTLLERGGAALATHTSQTPLSVEIALPDSTVAASSQYRAGNDPSLKRARRFKLIDTPGHGKLRHYAVDQLAKAQNLKGIIFLVDAAAVSSEQGGGSSGGGGREALPSSLPSSSASPSSSSAGLTATAAYLHDVLLALQKRYTEAKTSKAPAEMPVLLAANKLDLFTALPAPLVKAALEKEITSVRNTRAKGLKDSGVAMGEDAIDEEREWLGDGGDGKFEFKQMEEVNVFVEVIGGNVLGDEGPSVGKWWDWIGRQM